MPSIDPGLPGYELVERLGRGGFATVYRARQLAVGREVALKIDDRVLTSPRDRQRFMREVTAAGQLSSHPHVVALHDAGVLPDGRPYMVLELCPGGSLADRLREYGPLPATEARTIGVRIADALAAAHTAGVLHRDVKPGNILVNQYGEVALADFGLAAMPRPGHELSATREALTPAYAPPEAFRMDHPLPVGDVYALAATVYALLRGRPPHYPDEGDLSLAELIVRHTQPVPDLPGVSPGLTDVIRQAMAADPQQRTSSALALRDALASVDLQTHYVRPVADRVPPSPAPPWDTPSHAAVPHAALPHAAVPTAAVPNDAAWHDTTSRRDTAPPQDAVPPHAAGWGTWPPHQPAPAPLTTPPPAVVSPVGQTSGTPASAGATPPRDEPVARSRAKDRRRMLLVAPVAGLAMAGLGAAGVLALQDGGEGGGKDGAGGSSSSSGANAARDSATTGKGGYTVPTVSKSCAATSVSGADARCTKTAECWGGMVVTVGVVTGITRADCAEAHYWETFAIAPLPSDGLTVNQEDLSKHPVVRKVCSRDVMARSRRPEMESVAPNRWTIDVLPPTQSEFDKGVRVYRCIATITGEEKAGSTFRPRA